MRCRSGTTSVRGDCPMVSTPRRVKPSPSLPVVGSEGLQVRHGAVQCADTLEFGSVVKLTLAGAEGLGHLQTEPRCHLDIHLVIGARGRAGNRYLSRKGYSHYGGTGGGSGLH